VKTDTITLTIRVRDEATPVLRRIAYEEAVRAEIRRARKAGVWNRWQMVGAR